jgi:MFS family permease
VLEPTRAQRRLLALVFTISLTSIMGNTLIAPAIPDILDTFGREPGSSGVLVAAIPLPGIVIAPLIGILADRLGRRRVLVPCLAIFGVAGILVATAQSFEWLLLARFFQGFGSAGLINLGVVLITDHFSGMERTHWIGRNSAALILALAVFPVVSGIVTHSFGWRWALAPYGLSLITATIAWRMLEPDVPHVTPPIRQQLGGIGDALRNPVLASTLAGGALAFAVTFGAFLTALPTHLEEDFGLSAAWRGVIIGLPGVPAFVTAFNFARLRGRWSTGLVLMGAAVCWIVGFTLIGLAPTIAVLVVGTLFYGLADGALIPSLQDTTSRFAPETHRAAVMATWTGCARAGQASGPLVAGAVIAGWDTTAGILTGVGCAIGMLLIFALGPIRRLG